VNQNLMADYTLAAANANPIAVNPADRPRTDP